MEVKSGSGVVNLVSDESRLGRPFMFMLVGAHWGGLTEGGGFTVGGLTVGGSDPEAPTESASMNPGIILSVHNLQKK